MSSSNGTESSRAVRLDPSFGSWLKKTRISLGVATQAELAKRAKAHKTYIGYLESSKPYPYALSTFVGIADALDLELGYLLHKAGLDIGRDGLNMAKVRRAEAIADAFESFAVTMRSAIAEAMNALDPKLPVGPRAADAAISDLGVALGLLDLAEGRLRNDGWITGIAKPETHQLQASPWTPEEDDYLRLHRAMPHDDAAQALNRTVESVRNRRTRLFGTSAVKGEA